MAEPKWQSLHCYKKRALATCCVKAVSLYLLWSSPNFGCVFDRCIASWLPTHLRPQRSHGPGNCANNHPAGMSILQVVYIFIWTARRIYSFFGWSDYVSCAVLQYFASEGVQNWRPADATICPTPCCRVESWISAFQVGLELDDWWNTGPQHKDLVAYCKEKVKNGIFFFFVRGLTSASLSLKTTQFCQRTSPSQI